MSSFYVQRDMVSQHIAQPCGRVESDRKILVKTFVCPRGTHNSRSSLTAHVAHTSKDGICLPRGKHQKTVFVCQVAHIKRSSLSATLHTHIKRSSLSQQSSSSAPCGTIPMRLKKSSGLYPSKFCRSQTKR